ncbi:MAG: TonB-dependent receptor [Methylococcales bacterium]|nr:TonB-dependent receptor [Methylococcales bacterium]
MSRKVITASKTEQTFSDAAAGVFVIHQNDLRRSGATSIPEALRMVPGLQVARIDTNKWAISARGFNGRFANKLLVLIDGRAVYSPAFSGVYWEINDLMLEDVDRIEVIRGPGASVWGANAVNGIINVISKKSSETQGELVSVTAGNEYQSAAVRYGNKFDEQGHYRVYTKYFRHDGFVDRNGDDAEDDWDMFRGGFKVDWTPTSSNTLMLQGDVYTGDINQNFIVPSESSLTGGKRVLEEAGAYGGSFLGRWDYTHSLASRMSTQIYYEHLRRNGTFQNEALDTVDFDFQHELAVVKNHEVSWGLEYRLHIERFKDAEIVSVSPSKRNLHLISAFLQDQIGLFDNRLTVTIGSKVEYHTLSDFEFQPNIRLMWNASSNQRLWAAFSRATRTPSRGEKDAQLNIFGIPRTPQDTPNKIVLHSNSDFKSEDVLSYELGYRTWFGDYFSFDMVTFYNDYDNLIFAELATITQPGEIPLRMTNDEKAKTWGVEISADWRPVDWMRLQLAYTYLGMDYEQKKNKIGAVSGIGFPTGDARSPENQISLRSSFDLSHNTELDIWFRYVDDIADIVVVNPSQLPPVQSYVTVDVRLGWHPHKNIELAIVGKNLNNAERVEYLNEIGSFPTQVERSFYGQLKWKF